MHHHDNVRPSGNCLFIAGLLITPISVVLLMHVNAQTQLFGDAHSVVRAMIIHEDLEVNGFWHLADGFRQCFRRIVSGHHDRDAFTVNHVAFSSLTAGPGESESDNHIRFPITRTLPQTFHWTFKILRDIRSKNHFSWLSGSPQYGNSLRRFRLGCIGRSYSSGQTVFYGG